MGSWHGASLAVTCWNWTSARQELADSREFAFYMAFAEEMEETCDGLDVDQGINAAVLLRSYMEVHRIEEQ